jgi:trk system potassium uptake protein TrkH
MRRMLHPNAVTVVRFEGKPVPEKTLRGVHLYLTVYVMVFSVSVLLLSLEGFDLTTTFTAVTACFNNIGPGLEMVGPTGNFGAFSDGSKLVLILDMLAGRLEIFPILALFSRSTWTGK